VEEVLAGFAADGEAAGDVGARSQATLHGIADGHIFILNFFADGYALVMVLRGGGADVRKIIVKNHRALADSERQNKIGVHHAGVSVDHKVRVDPKIKRMTLARGADGRIESAGRVERAGLETGALKILDGVLGVFDDAAQSFVGVGHVVAAIEVVVHVNLPIAVERVDAAIKVVELPGELERGGEIGNFAKEFVEGRSLAFEIGEEEILPDVQAHGNEAVIGAIEIADALELDHALEGAIVAVGPAMIGAAKLFGATVGFGNDSRGMMTADVIEGAKFAVIAANNDERFFVDVDGEKLAAVLDLIETADDLPVGGEDKVAFELGDARIEIPGSRNGPGILEGIGGIVEIKDVANAALVHDEGLRNEYQKGGLHSEAERAREASGWGRGDVTGMGRGSCGGIRFLKEKMVRERGVEPPRPFGHKILSLARLPIPPLPHVYFL
jgi:hypothetical protein